MRTADLTYADGCQAVKLPDDFRFVGSTVSIRKSGEAVILEPIKADCWPDAFFDNIRIDDPAFNRPPQGPVPPAPAMSSAK